MRRFAESQQEAIGRNAQTGVSAEDAGRAIEAGIKGPGGFIERTQAVWNRLDADLAAKVPQNAAIAPQNTVQRLTALTTPTPGAERTTGALINPKLAEIQKGMEADLKANNGVMPFNALRALRTDVGSMLENSLVSGVPNGQLKQLYGALSADMEVAANAAGAGKEFARQNQYYSARMDRIESVLNRVLGDAKQPEDVFKAVMPTDPNQSNKLRAVMRSLPESDRQVVTNAVVSRMGRATPGKQNEVGDAFSSETFLTNWNRLSPEAKAQIFPDPGTRNDMNAIASVSANIREGSKVFANPSGSGQIFASGGLLAMVATGRVAEATTLVAGTNVGARMLTNPRVVRWLATAPKVEPANMPAHLARLGVIFNQTNDPQLKSELADFLSSR